MFSHDKAKQSLMDHMIMAYHSCMYVSCSTRYIASASEVEKARVATDYKKINNEKVIQ